MIRGGTQLSCPGTDVFPARGHEWTNATKLSAGQATPREEVTPEKPLTKLPHPMLEIAESVMCPFDNLSSTRIRFSSLVRGGILSKSTNRPNRVWGWRTGVGHTDQGSKKQSRQMARHGGDSALIRNTGVLSNSARPEPTGEFQANLIACGLSIRRRHPLRLFSSPVFKGGRCISVIRISCDPCVQWVHGHSRSKRRAHQRL